MKTIAIALALSLSALASAIPAQALRCGTNLASKGDHFSEVLDKCGEPDFSDEWIEYKTYRIYDERLPMVYHDVSRPVTVKEWTYNFGPNRFMQVLRFENGKLVDIHSLGYGH